MALQFAGVDEELSDEELTAFLASGAGDDDGLDETAFLDDPDPGFEKPSVAERVLGAKNSKAKTSTQGRKPTAAVRKDIRGKVAMMMMMGATVWETRDAPCGAALSEAVPDVSDALTDILCDSPDIVNWFTSSGRYLKWLNLAAALQPVMGTLFAHHVTHSIEDEDAPPPDWSQYRAGG